MNNKINLSELASIVAKQTQIEQSLVEKFIETFHSEIEISLLKKNAIKVKGLGIFKIIKGGASSTDKILYLADFSIAKDSEKADIPVKTQENTLNSDEDKKLSVRTADEAVWRQSTQIETEVDPSENEQDADSDEIANLDGHRKRSLKNISIVTILVIIFAVVFYFFFVSGNAQQSPPNKMSDKALLYKETVNNDTAHYASVIETTSDINILRISSQYYGNEIFWGYIFEANKDVINDPLNIKKGTILKIPKMSAELINDANKLSLQKAKDLSAKILKQR
ncbi:MAG: HU family DNA-binding protein [Dysgonomonas sp.]